MCRAQITCSIFHLAACGFASAAALCREKPQILMPPDPQSRKRQEEELNTLCLRDA
jgi:hypothetical protein